MPVLRIAAGLAGALALSACASVPSEPSPVHLKVAGPPISAEKTGEAFIYRIPQPDTPPGIGAQQWSMLGREDRGAATGDGDYIARPCGQVPGGASGWSNVIDAIVARADRHRVVIINESHSVTRHRELIRQLLPRLRALGFTTYAAETFAHGDEGTDPVALFAAKPWVNQNEGYYLREPVFGRLVRQAKGLGYRLAAYEERSSQSAPEGAGRGERIRARETAQAENLAAIVAQMAPEERLVVHVGYSHASEVPVSRDGGSSDTWMAARLKALTGIDPLTLSQTVCSHPDEEPFLAQSPDDAPPGVFDLVVSHPVAMFREYRTRWRRDGPDIAVEIPQALRPTSQPVVIEAFAAGDPMDAVPIDRVYAEPGEDVPLLLPPGDYTVRAVLPSPN